MIENPPEEIEPPKELAEEIAKDIQEMQMSGVLGVKFYPSGGKNGLRPGERFQDSSGRWYFVNERGNFIRIPAGV